MSCISGSSCIILFEVLSNWCMYPYILTAYVGDEPEIPGCGDQHSELPEPAGGYRALLLEAVTEALQLGG